MAFSLTEHYLSTNKLISFKSVSLKSLLYWSISLWLLMGCSAKGEMNVEQSKELVVPYVPVIQQDTYLQYEYVAEINAVRHVEIRARVQGYLERIMVDEGQFIKKGQPLFQISNAEYKAEVAKANAMLKSAIAEAKAAELEMERVGLLVEKNVIAATEWELAKARLAAANAKIEEARSSESNAALKLSYTYIRAPFNGVIDRIPFKVGSLVNEGTLLTKVSDINAIYAYFNVSESEYLEYMKSQTQEDGRDNVQLILADGSMYPLTGKIETMDGEFDATTGSIAFRAKFENPEKILKHGSSGKIKLSNKVNDAILVPQKATFEIQDKVYVFVVDAQNKVKMRSIVPKGRISHFYWVDSGIKIGEKVIFEGVQSLKDGNTVKPFPISSDSLLVQSPNAKDLF